MSTVRPDPVRLDQALERIGRSDRADVSRPQLERFSAVWRDPSPVEEGMASRDGLVDEIFEFIMPELNNPNMFEGSRYLDLLEDLSDQLGDPEEATEQIDRWGALVIRHEVRKHRLLWQYLNSLVDT
ncbi:MAG: hypothetical protein AAGA21_02965 [Pseudomonadota bacterium]